MELKILKILYKNVINIELNKFPLNKPCTIKYVTDHIGVKDESLVWDILTDGDINNVAPYMCYYDSKRYNIRVTDLSESEVRILVDRNLDDWDDYCRYNHHDRNDQYNIHTIILPNWRFVESMDSSIFYVERMS